MDTQVTIKNILLTFSILFVVSATELSDIYGRMLEQIKLDHTFA